MATEEMRNDFDEMTATHQRPKDFRLKVRNHHGLLTITSLNKLNFSEDIEISFSGENLQTYCLLKTKPAIENNFNALKTLIKTIGFPAKENRIENKGKIRYLFYQNTNLDSLCSFIDSFKIEQPSINNSTLTDYINSHAKSNCIKEWSICIVGNSDERVFIDYIGNTPRNERKPNKKVATFELENDNETITIGCSVRNQQIGRGGKFYSISRNQIDQTGDRYIDLKKGMDYSKMEYAEIKEQRKSEGKGLLLIYALDERGTPNLNNGIPIIGYSLHFPRIKDEIKVSYKASINHELDIEVMEDDDNPEIEINE
jgi:hypothetical protein